jgi:hypothetical protein
MFIAAPSRSRSSSFLKEKSFGLGKTSAIAGASPAMVGVGAGLALATTGIQAWIQSARLRGGQKLAATNVANEIERKLKDLKTAYEASPKSIADWQYAKQTEEQLFDFLQQGCGTQQMGSAGQRCIEERYCFEGEGCKYPWRTWYDIGPAPLAADGSTSVLGADGLTVVNSPTQTSSNNLNLNLGTPVLLGIGLLGIGLVMMTMGDQ